MKRYRIWMLGAFVVVTALLVGATIKARQNPLYQLSRYPQTPAFKSYVTDVSGEMKDSATDALIKISEPRDGEFKDVLEYKISSDRKIALNIRGFAVGSGGQSRGGSLDARQLAQVEKLADQLPPSAPPAKREDLLVVFLYKPGPTQLRLYDHRHPPLQVRQIVGILTNSVEKWINQLPDEQQPSSPFFPHFQSSLRPSSPQIPSAP